MKTHSSEMRIIETDAFPFEFLSRIAERESWRKEIHRPIYHVHKWWAKRLGSVFRGILLGCTLPKTADLEEEFYSKHAPSGISVFDPFMGSGTTIGEAHKLGLSAIGRDINPVAVQAVETAMGPLDRRRLVDAFEQLAGGAGKQILALYQSRDRRDRPAAVLYHFWVMQAPCPECHKAVDLFSSYVIASNAYPHRKPEVQILCPRCGDIFPGIHGCHNVACPTCHHAFDASDGPVHRNKAICGHCTAKFTIIDAISRTMARPVFRLYGKLVLTQDGSKEYLGATKNDLADYRRCSRLLQEELDAGRITLPKLSLQDGHNTRQAIGYNFKTWTDFFGDRQLLALSWLRNAILQLPDATARRALLTLFSGALEFNNLFASYKGEGTGAVRHMFSHHILKPERTPIEANVWGTHKSSGAFVNLFRTRLLRALDYREAPTEVIGASGPGRVCADAFGGSLAASWPTKGTYASRSIFLSCGDSAVTGLASDSVDLVVTDPPFFDNVHYSELADFFYAWQQHSPDAAATRSTRHRAEVQDAASDQFARKLETVLRECHRVLKPLGLLVFTYHHSREEGWQALAEAIIGAGFLVVNSHPVKSEMSVATPKAQAKDPINLDIIVVCRKRTAVASRARPSVQLALRNGLRKIDRLITAGFTLSANDRRIALYGQLLAAISNPAELSEESVAVDAALAASPPTSAPRCKRSEQGILFKGQG